MKDLLCVDCRILIQSYIITMTRAPLIAKASKCFFLVCLLQLQAVMYYTTTFMIQDELSQKLGLVAVIYCATTTSYDSRMFLFHQDKIQREASEKLSKIIHYLPFRYTGFHFCASDWFVKVSAPLIKMIIGRTYRVRLRVHVGTFFSLHALLLLFFYMVGLTWYNPTHAFTSCSVASTHVR